MILVQAMDDESKDFKFNADLLSKLRGKIIVWDQTELEKLALYYTSEPKLSQASLDEAIKKTIEWAKEQRKKNK